MKSIFLCAVFVTACSKPAATPAPKTEPRTDPNAKPYQLSVEAPANAKLGAANQFRIQLTPAPRYHINDEGFPFEIEIVTSAAKIAKTKLEQADANIFKKEQASFVIPF